MKLKMYSPNLSKNAPFIHREEVVAQDKSFHIWCCCKHNASFLSLSLLPHPLMSPSSFDTTFLSGSLRAFDIV